MSRFWTQGSWVLLFFFLSVIGLEISIRMFFQLISHTDILWFNSTDTGLYVSNRSTTVEYKITCWFRVK